MFKTILCATDLKEDSISAFKKAIQIAHQFNSKIYLLITIRSLKKVES